MVNLYNLFTRIKEREISATQLSKDTGISTGNISDWKVGRSIPGAVKLDILANYLDCSVDYLLGRTNNPQIVAPIGTAKPHEETLDEMIERMKVKPDKDLAEAIEKNKVTSGDEELDRLIEVVQKKGRNGELAPEETIVVKSFLRKMVQ